MSYFSAPDDYRRFAYDLRKTSRYIHSEAVKQFLQAVLDTCASRGQIIKKGHIFYRAQRGCIEKPLKAADCVISPSGEAALFADEPWFIENLKSVRPHSTSRMLPRKDKSTEGRANPKGIPCLYLASEPSTALSEMRPSNGSTLTLATCKTTRRLTLVDCSANGEWPDILLNKPAAEPFELLAWHNINSAFSNPVEQSDDLADYVPTQVLAELFRTKGYDGIFYKSAIALTGKNVALFDINSIRITERRVFHVKEVRYGFEPEKLIPLSKKKQRNV